jgi:thiol:disulfide interchange protein DsbA
MVSAKPAYEEGVEYQRVVPAQPTEAPTGKQEVVELFWYGCPHCFHLEPSLQEWLKAKPKDVLFRRMPAVLGDRWALLARAYYAAEALGVLETIHPKLLEAIHEDERQFPDKAAVQDFFAEQGVKREDFTQVFDSFFVESKLRHATTMTERYGIDGVPALVVNGEYRTSPAQAGGIEAAVEVVDFLLNNLASVPQEPTKTSPAQPTPPSAGK